MKKNGWIFWLPASLLLLLVSVFLAIALAKPELLQHTPVTLGIAAGMAVLTVLILVLTRIFFFAPISKISQALSALVKGEKVDWSQTQSRLSGAAALAAAAEQLDRRVTRATQFTRNIGADAPQLTEYAPTPEDRLGTALVEVQDKFAQFAESERNRAWAATGRTRFNTLLQSQHQSVEHLSKRFIQELCILLEAQVGALYLPDPEDTAQLKLMGSFALDREASAKRELDRQSSVPGQVMLDRKPAVIDYLPADYLPVSTGLGQQQPGQIMMVPIATQDESAGVFELARFHPFAAHEVELMVQVAEDLAVRLIDIFSKQLTEKLLKESQHAYTQLMEKEEAITKNSEALEAARDQAREQLFQLEEETAFSNSILKALNHTHALLRLDIEGTVISANPIYCTLLGREENELVGKPETQLLKENDGGSSVYQMMWDNLKAGSHFSGDFCRLHADGTEVWFQGSYSPVFNRKGEVSGIIKIANGVSELKQKDLQAKAQNYAMSRFFPTFYLTDQDKFQSPGKTFFEQTGWSRKEIRSISFSDLAVSGTYSAENWAADRTLLFQEGQAMRRSLSFAHQSGEKIPCTLIFSPVNNLSGAVSKIFVLMIPYLNPTAQPDSKSETANETLDYAGNYQ